MVLVLFFYILLSAEKFLLTECVCVFVHKDLYNRLAFTMKIFTGTVFLWVGEKMCSSLDKSALWA